MATPCSYEAINPAKEFIFGTIADQSASNSVYVSMSTMNGIQVENNLTPIKRFKSDRERMQYLAGSFARNPNCCNQGARCTTG